MHQTELIVAQEQLTQLLEHHRQLLQIEHREERLPQQQHAVIERAHQQFLIALVDRHLQSLILEQVEEQHLQLAHLLELAEAPTTYLVLQEVQGLVTLLLAIVQREQIQEL